MDPTALVDPFEVDAHAGEAERQGQGKAELSKRRSQVERSRLAVAIGGGGIDALQPDPARMGAVVPGARPGEHDDRAFVLGDVLERRDVVPRKLEKPEQLAVLDDWPELFVALDEIPGLRALSGSIG